MILDTMHFGVKPQIENNQKIRKQTLVNMLAKVMINTQYMKQFAHTTYGQHATYELVQLSTTKTYQLAVKKSQQLAIMIIDHLAILMR